MVNLITPPPQGFYGLDKSVCMYVCVMCMYVCLCVCVCVCVCEGRGEGGQYGPVGG